MGRLVTVLVTVLVPEAADPEDAAAGSALEVVHPVGVEGHLPVPGSVVMTPESGQPAAVVTLGEGTALLRQLDGDLQTSPLPALAPDLLETAGARRGLLGRDAP